jgi:hypothetical protein
VSKTQILKDRLEEAIEKEKQFTHSGESDIDKSIHRLVVEIEYLNNLISTGIASTPHYQSEAMKIASAINDETAKEMSIEKLCLWVEALEEIKREIGPLVTTINSSLADLMENNTPIMEIPSAPVLKWGATRKSWDNESLLSEVRKRIVKEAEEAGLNEVQLVIINTAITQLNHVYRLAGANARIKALKEMGIDPDEYCESLPPVPRIQFLNR